MTAALLGRAFLLVGCTALGLLARGRLRARRRCLAAFRQSLEALARELEFSLKPLDQLIRGGPGEVGLFYVVCRRLFAENGGGSWADAWQEGLHRADLPLTEEDLDLLAEAGTFLGQYDGQIQKAGLDGVIGRLSLAFQGAKESEARLGRVYVTLGVAAGVFLVILL